MICEETADLLFHEIIFLSLLITGGCIPVDEGGSDSYQDARNGWWDTCEKLGIECQCRPMSKYNNWNVPINASDVSSHNLYQDMHAASWEVLRILDEHRRGLIKLGGLSVKCDFRHPEIYNQARELGVPVFLMGRNEPRPGEENYGLPQRK
jgi:hypothetical protein